MRRVEGGFRAGHGPLPFEGRPIDAELSVVGLGLFE